MRASIIISELKTLPSNKNKTMVEMNSFGIDGDKVQEPFILSLENDYYTTKLTNRSESTEVSFQLDDEIIIITNQLRGFLKSGKDFLNGKVLWEDFIKLNKDEKILTVLCKETLNQYEYVEFDNQWMTHTSFLFRGASSRGKKFFKDKYQVNSFKLTNKKPAFKQMH